MRLPRRKYDDQGRLIRYPTKPRPKPKPKSKPKPRPKSKPKPNQGWVIDPPQSTKPRTGPASAITTTPTPGKPKPKPKSKPREDRGNR